MPRIKLGCCQHVLAAVLLSGFLSASRTSAALIAYDGFNYADGSTLTNQNGGTGWGGAWVANGTPGAGATNVATSLTYTDGANNALQTSGGSAFLSGTSTANTTAQPYRELPADLGADGTSTWISFLAVRTGPVTNLVQPFFQRAIGFQLRTSAGVEQMSVGRGTTNNTPPMDTWSLFFGGSGLNTQPTTVSMSNVTFLVLRLDHVAGDDNVYLFVNPTLGVEPNIATAAVSTNGNGTFRRILLFAGNSTAAGIFAQMRVDEIRIGTSYADVSPILVVGNPPGIVTDLTNQLAELCATASFHVNATGTPPLHYQWFFNNGPTGGDSNSLVIPNVSGGNAGQYFVIVSNSINAATSSIVTLSVVDTNVPVIVTCATNRLLDANFNQQAVLPNLASEVIATNICGSVTVTQSPSAGTILGPGTNLVTLTAVSGTNTTNCVTAVAVNGRPIAANQSVSTGKDLPANLALGATDAEGGPLTFHIISGPTHGSLGTLNSNLVTYTPASSYVGADAFTFAASDGRVTSAVATVTISVTNELIYPPLPIVKDGTAVLLEDYVTMPLSSRTPDNFTYSFYPPNINYADQLSRPNFLRSEPTNAPGFGTRLFICDLNRNLYILNKSNKTFTTYIDFEATFTKFDNNPGYAGGLVTFQFDPGYASNGLFYTVHTENPTKGNFGNDPTNPAVIPPAGYTTTTVINPPVASTVTRHGVLVEWRDTNIANTTFEGTARELLRVGFTGNIHPMGDLIFNPLAGPGHPDYRNLYVANGDGGAGESNTNDARHLLPQRLDALVGKVLRITPDLNLRPGDLLSSNGRYRIPSTGADPNPFVTTNGARPEIFTYGHRNPHRLVWDAETDKLIIFEIGLSTFEEVNIAHKGANYGYANREGTRMLLPTGSGYSAAPPGYATYALPDPDLLPIRVTNTPTATLVPIQYPAAQYFQTEGDAMSCGFVYRGTLMPSLRGKCIYGDITTGRIFYSDLAAMIAADDTNPATLAETSEIQVVFDNPNDAPDQGVTNRRVFDIVKDQYHFRGGTAFSLPGSAAVTAGNDPNGVPYGGGRSDIRISLGDDNELYLISKSDGTIRKFVAAISPPNIQSINHANGNVSLTWRSVPGWNYRIQYKTNITDLTWADLAGDVNAAGLTASKTNAVGSSTLFYRVKLLLP